MKRIASVSIGLGTVGNIRGLFLLLGACVLLVRHSGARSYIPHEAENLNIYIEEAHVTDAALDVYDYVENYPYIDYDYIEQYYQVLWHDIYSISTKDYAGTPLEEYLRPIEERDREQIALYGHGTALSMDYLYDGNLMNAHVPVAVLDEKTDGFYAMVLPGSNRILRYEKETGRYQFQERE